MREEPLSGGAVTTVVRVGQTVRRARSKRSAFVQRLLTFLEERGWHGAPRYLGVDERGREVLEYPGR